MSVNMSSLKIYESLMASQQESSFPSPSPSRVLSLEYQLDMIKWQASSDKLVSTEYQIPSKSKENFRWYVAKKFLLYCPHVTFKQGRAQ